MCVCVCVREREREREEGREIEYESIIKIRMFIILGASEVNVPIGTNLTMFELLYAVKI